MGYSAGAYLTVSATRKKSLNIKEIITISEVLDLRLLGKTSPNAVVQLTEAEATRLSLNKKLSIPISVKSLVLVGGMNLLVL